MSASAQQGDPILTDLPVLPLRDMVVYPQGVHPLFVGTERSIRALEAAMASDKQILLVAKRDASEENPSEEDLFDVGTVSTILQLLKLPDGTVKVLVEGGFRARVNRLEDDPQYLRADVEELTEPKISSREAEGLTRSVMTQFEQYVQLSKKVPQEVLTSLSSIEEPGRLVDTIAAQLALKIDEKQKVLETVELDKRIEQLLALMEGEIDLFQMEKRIRGRVK
ncbi:MAG TPA: LON peptidase substrate-binding domain-containing protein, partial [Pseudomonadales bacterium]|nr:LON peptidase substrate-binding domain-containing protein [Pseudomonadales bacterium]